MYALLVLPNGQLMKRSTIVLRKRNGKFFVPYCMSIRFFVRTVRSKFGGALPSVNGVRHTVLYQDAYTTYMYKKHAYVCVYKMNK